MLALVAVLAPAAQAANGWRPTGALANARADHSATLLPDGKVLVAGGGGQNLDRGSTERFTPSPAAWKLDARSPSPGNVIRRRC